MKIYGFCKICNKKIEQYLFKIIKYQIIDPTNITENDFSSEILPDWILNKLGFSDGHFTETTYNVGALFYFLRKDKNKDPVKQKNEINNTICALGISCELEKLKRKKKIQHWKSKDPLDWKSSIKIGDKYISYNRPTLFAKFSQ